MGALKIVGGILAVAGAGLVLFMVISAIINYGFNTYLGILLILPIVALVGGILALAGKRAGGIIALIVGAIWLIMAILLSLDVLPPMPTELLYLLTQLPSLSFFVVYVDFTIWVFLTVEIVLVFVGGILATAGGSD
jgi:hypothetical protein